MTDPTAAWERYLDALERFVADPFGSGAQVEERPARPIPTPLVARAEAVLADLEATQAGLEESLASVSSQMRASADGRRRLRLASTRSSAVDLMA